MKCPSTSTELRFLSTSDLRGPLSGGQEERTERWHSPMEKEARRERKTDSAPKVAEKGGWIAHRESARKKDGQDTGMTGKGEARRTKETRRRKEFEGVGRRSFSSTSSSFLLLLFLLRSFSSSSSSSALSFLPSGRILFSPFSNYR